MDLNNLPKIGNSRATILDNPSVWGVYVWQKSNGKWFTDGNGNILNIPANKGDVNQIKKLEEAARYYGEGDGKAVFFGGLNRVSDEEYSEQVDRMSQGLIPSLNDIGAVMAAKNTIKEHGAE